MLPARLFAQVKDLTSQLQAALDTAYTIARELGGGMSRAEGGGASGLHERG